MEPGVAFHLHAACGIGMAAFLILNMAWTEAYEFRGVLWYLNN